MHANKIAIVGSVALSFVIMMTGVQMSSHNTYSVPFIKSANAYSLEVDSLKEAAVKEVSFDELSKKERKEVECLAKNIYYEAGFEPHNGKVAVASVTMNRVMTGNYADTICGVVHQKTGSTYQFSWVGMKNRLSKINESVYNEILELATSMYLNYDSSKDVTKGATFYHADYIHPRWKLQRVKKIGRHIFYRSKNDYAQLGE